MTRLNDRAATLAARFGVRGATDVTGFSLLGHGLEVAQASKVGIRIFAGSVPFLRGAAGYARRGLVPGGTGDNRRYFGPKVTFDDAVDDVTRWLLFDAQTSGGLLLCVAEKDFGRFLDAARADETGAWPIGRVEAGGGVHVDRGGFPGLEVSQSPRVPGVVFAGDE
jgi:selenide,water dikinase